MEIRTPSLIGESGSVVVVFANLHTQDSHRQLIRASSDPLLMESHLTNHIFATHSKQRCGVPGISVQFFTALPGGYSMISVPFCFPQTFAS